MNTSNFIRKTKAAPKELLPLEHSEFKRLLDAANAEDKLIIILAGLYTLKRSEIAGLCGEDILWDMNSIYVHSERIKTKDMAWIRKEMPKTAQSVRRIELAPEIMAMIPHVGSKEYVIKLTPDAITRRFEKLRAKVCVSCHLHDLVKYSDQIRNYAQQIC